LSKQGSRDTICQETNICILMLKKMIALMTLREQWFIMW